MLTLSSGAALARALTLPIDRRLRGLLALRRDQLGGEFAGHARFVIINPRDLPRWVADALGWSPLQNAATGCWWGDPDYSPGFEWIEDHGFCWELAYQFTDDFTHVILVERAPGVHPDFTAFCEAHAPQHA